MEADFIEVMQIIMPSIKALEEKGLPSSRIANLLDFTANWLRSREPTPVEAVKPVVDLTYASDDALIAECLNRQSKNLRLTATKKMWIGGFGHHEGAYVLSFFGS